MRRAARRGVAFVFTKPVLEDGDRHRACRDNDVEVPRAARPPDVGVIDAHLVDLGALGHEVTASARRGENPVGVEVLQGRWGRHEHAPRVPPGDVAELPLVVTEVEHVAVTLEHERCELGGQVDNAEVEVSVEVGVRADRAHDQTAAFFHGGLLPVERERGGPDAPRPPPYARDASCLRCAYLCFSALPSVGASGKSARRAGSVRASDSDGQKKPP